MPMPSVNGKVIEARHQPQQKLEVMERYWGCGARLRSIARAVLEQDVAPVPDSKRAPGQDLDNGALLRTRILGIRTSCHYGQEIAASSMRVTGGSWLGAMNAA